MHLQLLIAQWSGSLPPGFVRPAILDTGLATCCLCGATHNWHTSVADPAFAGRGAAAPVVAPSAALPSDPASGAAPANRVVPRSFLFLVTFLKENLIRRAWALRPLRACAASLEIRRTVASDVQKLGLPLCDARPAFAAKPPHDAVVGRAGVA